MLTAILATGEPTGSMILPTRLIVRDSTAPPSAV
jgi:DNA-binding LacI/PurR family transcriptional regulator